MDMAIGILIAFGVVQTSAAGRIANHAFARGLTRQAVHASTRTTPDEAKPFLGEWTTVVDGPAGPINFIIDIKVQENRALAAVSTDLLGQNTVEDITTTDTGIALRYTGAMWGYSVPMLVNLARDGDRLRASFSIMDGWFNFGGVATKKQRRP
jgi:hypothetical protein